MSIALAKKYLPLLDEVYAVNAKTSILDAPASMIQESAKANTILIPSVTVDGLGDYSRTAGFTSGTFDFSWESHEFTQDRGRSFVIDAQDNLETLDVAFAATTGEFIKTKVVPEVDAYRFAAMATKAGTTAEGTLTKDTALEAIDTGIETLLDAEVDLENVLLFVSPKTHTYLKQSDLISRKAEVNMPNGAVNRDIETLDGIPLIVVPQSRFYSAISLYDGSTEGETTGGYVKGDTAVNINFMLVDPNAVLGLKKTALPRIFSPEVYQDANAWKFDYRLYHDLFVKGNKVDGIYVHTAEAAS